MSQAHKGKSLERIRNTFLSPSAGFNYLMTLSTVFETFAHTAGWWSTCRCTELAVSRGVHSIP